LAHLDAHAARLVQHAVQLCLLGARLAHPGRLADRGARPVGRVAPLRGLPCQ
jgi:hypothetical protein